LGENTAVDYSRQLAVGMYFGSLALAIVLCFVGSSWLSGQIEDLEQQRNAKKTELTRLQSVTGEVKEIESKQKGLEDRLVRIATLMRNKQGPVRVLDALNTAIPERAWLTEVHEHSGDMKLGGFALDGETISAFMRELEKSDYFPKVELDVARQATKQGVKIQEFAIKAKVSYAGKIVPVDDQGDKSKPAAQSKAPASH
jgi:Tfp pilus assembly protein PilN